MASSTTTTIVLEQKTQKLTLERPVPSGDTAAKIIFYKDPEDGATPFNYVYAPPEGQPQNNFGSDTVNVAIHDIRGIESKFSVDSAGFVALPNIPSKLVYDDWQNDDIIKKNYYPEVEQLLLDNLTGANRVFVFDHTIRRSAPLANTSPADTRGPVHRAHIDQTGEAALNRVRFHLPEEADELVKGILHFIASIRAIVLSGNILRRNKEYFLGSITFPFSSFQRPSPHRQCLEATKGTDSCVPVGNGR